MTRETVVTRVELPGIPVHHRGKVRDVFDLGEDLLLVATDRLSAFDVVLPQGIPGKGRVLNQLSHFWFEKLRHVVAHHAVAVDVDAFPPSLAPYREVLAGRSMLCRKAEALPVECVVRGYIAGSGYKEYQAKGSVSSIPLPEGLRPFERLPRPIFTPTTKAQTGHDLPISREDVAEAIGKKLASDVERISLELYVEAARWALERGVIIADTKFEFGLRNGELLLIDEALTPDSSRFWPSGEYRLGQTPPSLDKQFVRDYLESTGWSKQPPAPDLPAEIIEGTSRRYQEILDILTH